ncbi:hypothetical protein CEXT_773361 [Caerostris extrusa]|uniref:Uncharacterized protein n=1 Tax=Caerostris extrusa TaxID=172846 RepID=A0AAV4YCZ0_CAEEX|nr:hypothetical protein CEXT_773361 [Caerostris extrusa]
MVARKKEKIQKEKQKNLYLEIFLDNYRPRTSTLPFWRSHLLQMANPSVMRSTPFFLAEKNWISTFLQTFPHCQRSIHIYNFRGFVFWFCSVPLRV